MTAPHSSITGNEQGDKPVTIFGPDFPFPYDDWLKHPAGLGKIPDDKLGSEVAIIGAGMAGMVAAYELTSHVGSADACIQSPLKARKV